MNKLNLYESAKEKVHKACKDVGSCEYTERQEESEIDIQQDPHSMVIWMYELSPKKPIPEKRMPPELEPNYLQVSAYGWCKAAGGKERNHLPMAVAVVSFIHGPARTLHLL